MYKKLLISLCMCSSIFAMESDQALVANRLPLLFPLGWGQLPSQYKVAAESQKSSTAQQVVQERIIFGVQCSECISSLNADSEMELANEARRHFFVVHRMVLTGIELRCLFEGKPVVSKDTIFV